MPNDECEEAKGLKLLLLEGVVKQAVMAERERCAKIAEGHHHHIDSKGVASHGSQCLDYQCNASIAKEIREA